MMLRPNHPVLHLRIKPHFTTHGTVTHLSVAYRIPKSALTGNDAHLSYVTQTGNVPSHPYTEAKVRAVDDAGRLPFIFVQVSDTQQQWRLGRDAIGDLTLQMEVFPRQVDMTTPMGPRIDLRVDNDGVQGVGAWFLPRVTQGDQYTNVVEWDLSESPPGTRAVWSHGEGPGRVEHVGPSDTFHNTVFMVGPIQSSPPGPIPGNEPGMCVSYWFGSLPANIKRLKGFNAQLYAPMSRLFQHTEASYRVFMRSVFRGYGGSGYMDSFVFEYDADSADLPDDDIINLFAHEMVHSFSLMDPEDDGEENSWFIEGVAEYYSILLPYRFHLVPPSYVTAKVNSRLLGYYTSPENTMSMRDANKNFFTSWYAEKIPYNRGFAYLLLVDDQLRRLCGERDASAFGLLDEVILTLAFRAREGHKVVRKDWLMAIGHWLEGRADYLNEFHNMLDGRSVISLAGRWVGSPNNVLRETRQKVLQYGFSRLSIVNRVVQGVIPGSQAEQAGLRNGDRIVDNAKAWISADDPHTMYYIVVNRKGKDIMIDWLPRENERVPCWQLESFKEENIQAGWISGVN